jgi:hypothetical protein
VWGNKLSIKPGSLKKTKNHEAIRLERVISKLFPAKLSRRDTLTMLSGFDKNVNLKVIGAIYHSLKNN